MMMNPQLRETAQATIIKSLRWSSQRLPRRHESETCTLQICLTMPSHIYNCFNVVTFLTPDINKHIRTYTNNMLDIADYLR
jgi:hypothetical protein